MTEPISASRKRDDYDALTGGYCAADGSVQYSPGPTAGSPQQPTRATLPEARSSSTSVQTLVGKYDKKKADGRAALLERRRGGTELSIGVTSKRTSGAIEARASIVDAKVPVSKSHELKGLLGTSRAGIRFENSDGSKGASVGGGVALATIEWSYSSGSEAMSVGLDVGFSAGVSFGGRDADGDAVPETCFGIDAGVSVAGCSEAPAPPQAEGPRDGARGTGGNPRMPGAGGTSGW